MEEDYPSRSCVTLHNIPEGLAVGVAFGAAASGLPSATLAGAGALTKKGRKEAAIVVRKSRRFYAHCDIGNYSLNLIFID